MRNVKIKTKLIAGFVLVVLFAVAVGSVGVLSINNIDSLYSAAINNHAIPLEEAGLALADLQSMRAELRGAMLFAGQADRVTSQETIVKGLFTNFETRYDNIVDTFVRPEAAAVMRECIEVYTNSFKPAATQLLTDAKNPDVTSAQLAAYMLSDIKPHIDVVTSDFEQAMGIKTEMLHSTSEEASDTAYFVYIALIATVAAVVVIGITFGFVISNGIAKSINKISVVVDKVSTGDFSERIDFLSKNELGVLAARSNAMFDNLRNALHKVSDVADVVDDSSRQVASSSMSLAQISTEQAGSSEEISASMQDITSKTKTNSDYAEQASILSDATREKAAQGNQRMDEMLNAMEAINDASANISNIIKVIDDIAFQTNILALNAAVEAARAGSHGKGFAVVAEEVRNLAARSATAASETTTMIETSRKEVERGAMIAKETADSLKEIVGGVAETATLIANISTASRLQSDEASQISAGMNQVTAAVQSTSSIAEETASASSELSSQSNELKKIVSAFNLKIADHLADKSPSTAAAAAPAAKRQRTPLRSGQWTPTQPALGFRYKNANTGGDGDDDAVGK